MTLEVAKAAVHLGMKNTNTTGLLFYGGEPLLEKQLIYDTVAYTKSLAEEKKHVFFYKTTTNGTLLDEEFLKFSREVNLTIGFSHDGYEQDKCRLFHNGEGSFAVLEEKIPLLLKYQPYAVGMSVMDPSTVENAAKTVEFLFEKGFIYVSINVNYGAPWTESELEILRGEYEKMAEIYIRFTRAEQKIYLAPFDMKIVSHLKGKKYHADRRLMAKNQPSVAPDGKIYINSFHLNNPLYQIGDVFGGIDNERRDFLFEKCGELPEPCRECAIMTRCNYAYPNMAENEIVHVMSPIQCAHEQIITPIADRTAETLFGENNALFVHKHYNKMYPMLSLVEDMSD
jgi:uncharacterized protein